MSDATTWSSSAGGAVDPRLMAVLMEVGCGHMRAAIGGQTAAGWVEAMEASRPSFLKRLQEEYGVGRLAERQAIANKLSKARREGRV